MAHLIHVAIVFAVLVTRISAQSTYYTSAYNLLAPCYSYVKTWVKPNIIVLYEDFDAIFQPIHMPLFHHLTTTKELQCELSSSLHGLCQTCTNTSKF
jgi:hypothetical protein